MDVDVELLMLGNLAEVEQHLMMQYLFRVLLHLLFLQLPAVEVGDAMVLEAVLQLMVIRNPEPTLLRLVHLWWVLQGHPEFSLGQIKCLTFSAPRICQTPVCLELIVNPTRKCP
jgi:hypothetical protein